MDNIWKPRGALKSQKPDAGGAVLRTLPMLGTVKDNVDPTRSGRIRVFISALGGKDPDDEKNWTPVLYMSPFFGATDPSGGNSGYGSYKANPSSYGMWNSPPDIGTIVICLFINGDPNFGFYIGSIPDAEAMRMIPAIGANFTNEDVIFDKSEAEKYGGAKRVPVTNMNTNNSNQANSSTFLTAPKPVHSFQASIMFQQGVLRDPIRGPISSSAQRESPSRVGWGVSTPGRPIYQGGYTDSTITDAANKSGQKENLKVISRRGGHSIVMDDGDLVGQDNLIRIRTSLGHQILMSDDGQTLMLLHSNGQSYIELGKEGTIDLYSTNSVNIRTHGDLNLHADNNINLNAAKKLNIHANEIEINSETTIKQRAGSDYNVYTQGTHTHKVDGSMSMASTGEASYASEGTTYVNGSVINLNTGSTSTTPQEVAPIPVIAQTDTLFSSTKGWAAAPGKLLTIVSRAPAHTPWANACQGVDVKTNLDAEAQLPSSPSPEVESANSVASTTNDYPAITVPGAATVPSVPAASEALDKSSTSALVSASAAQAAVSNAASAVQAGAGVVKDAAGKVTGVAVGVTGLDANALQSTGTIKPGSGPFVTSLVQSGKSLPAAMPSNLFTGNNGVGNLSGLVNNVAAQAKLTVTNIQQAQTALTKSGLISGKEGAGGIAGAVLSTASNGINATVNAIKNIGAGVNALQNNITGAANSVMKSFAGGNFAANLSQNVMSGLSGISGAVSSMSKGLSGLLDSAKGVAASAFSAITKSFKSFTPGVPQNLTALTSGESQPSTDAGSSTAASGVENIPGGLQTVSSVASKSLPGTDSIKTLINNAVTATTNNISLDKAVNAATGIANNVLGSAVAGSLNKLKSGAASLSSLASSVLPADAAAQLNSAIASLGSGGPVQIKIPTISLNTTDRSSLTSAIGSLLPSGVPAPNFGAASPTSVSALQANANRLSEQVKRQQELIDQQREQGKVVDKAQATYLEAKQSLPAGDPEIQAAKDTLIEELAKYSKIADEVRAIADQA